MKTKHTPLPWHVAPSAGKSLIEDQHCNEVASVATYGAGFGPQGWPFPWHHAEANAALIVRAVNSHAELVAALETTTRLLALLNAPGTNDPIEAAVFKARAALSRANA